MKKNYTRDMAFLGIFTALITLFAQIPMIGFIQIPVLGFAITPIPAIIIAATLIMYVFDKNIWRGIAIGAFLAAVLGVNSLIVAYVRPTSIYDYAFRNVLVSVGTRVVFGLSIVPIYVLFAKFIKNTIVSLALTAALASVIHTVVVLTVFYTYGFTLIDIDAASMKVVLDVIITTLGANGLVELILAAIITPAIVSRVKVYMEA